VLNDSECTRPNNIPIPLERSPPVSFKRLLGGILCDVSHRRDEALEELLNELWVVRATSRHDQVEGESACTAAWPKRLVGSTTLGANSPALRWSDIQAMPKATRFVRYQIDGVVTVVP